MAGKGVQETSGIGGIGKLSNHGTNTVFNPVNARAADNFYSGFSIYQTKFEPFQ